MKTISLEALISNQKITKTLQYGTQILNNYHNHNRMGVGMHHYGVDLFYNALIMHFLFITSL